MQIILASSSPRRKELLTKLGYVFSVVDSGFKEKEFTNDPVETAIAFAKGKAETVYRSLMNKDKKIVLGADTVVFHEDKILGKAKDDMHARLLLKNLSGKTHVVITGYAVVCNGKTTVGYSQSKVSFNVLTEALIDAYVSSGLYKGKAGAYGIQDGFGLVKNCEGSIDNVIGLPTEEIDLILSNILNGNK